jgi:hypothetical protein
LEASIVDRDTSNALLDLAKSFFYIERSVPLVLKTAELRGQIDGGDRAKIETFLASHDYDLKKRDAKLVVQEVVKFCDR